MLVLAPPIYWFCLYQVLGWPFGWPYRWAPAELTVAVSLATLYLVGTLSCVDWYHFPCWPLHLLVLQTRFKSWSGGLLRAYRS
jgi:hypothetical protein